MAIGAGIDPTYPVPHDPTSSGNWADQLVGSGGVLPQMVAKINELDAALATFLGRLSVNVTVGTTAPASPTLNDIWIDIS